jgi:hypothetical protein
MHSQRTNFVSAPTPTPQPSDHTMSWLDHQYGGPRCDTCKTPLDNQDRQVTTGRYWTNCQLCRDIQTSKKRIRAGRAPVLHLTPRTMSHLLRGRTLTADSHIPVARLDREVDSVRRPCPCLFDDMHSTSYSSARSRRPTGVTQKVFDDRHIRTNPSPSKKPFHIRPLGWPSRLPSSRYSVPDNEKKEQAAIEELESEEEEQAAMDEPVCSVCSDAPPDEGFPRLKRCSHEPEVCRDCFEGWLTSQVESTAWDRIKCPVATCSVIIRHKAMKKLALEDTYDQ